ncbi:protein of unknown function [Methylorubrum extorquens]|uniref:Uncharacterized protein n=1 Tax=Methylorubrum extorquens TaxID=408 RepID=A0A2N9ATK1_METEX|nr:protein of unknown function [Methylorubrum extorquens]
MASLMKPYSDGDYVIGPGQAFFVVSSPAREPGISIRRRRRLRGRRKAELRATGLPEDGIVPLGEVSLVRPRYPDPEWLEARQAATASLTAEEIEAHRNAVLGGMLASRHMTLGGSA